MFGPEEFLLKTVLVIDDEQSFTAILSEILQEHGYRVLIASDPMAGLAFARSEFPDVILVDLVMPEMTGWQLLKHLDEDITTASIPVIVLTAVAGEDEFIRRALERRSIKYLAKPLKVPDLLESIERMTAAKEKVREGI
ncbi:MAG: response regulator [Candidatus Sericytochromatia bacterium]|nr:response regulator [Candidatus Sericytochromatia bacterium]